MPPHTLLSVSINLVPVCRPLLLLVVLLELNCALVLSPEMALIGFKSFVEWVGGVYVWGAALCERDRYEGEVCEGAVSSVLHIFVAAAAGAWLTDD